MLFLLINAAFSGGGGVHTPFSVREDICAYHCDVTEIRVVSLLILSTEELGPLTFTVYEVISLVLYVSFYGFGSFINSFEVRIVLRTKRVLEALLWRLAPLPSGGILLPPRGL
jgi:hypothetical protein